jgi:hypothetical protein
MRAFDLFIESDAQTGAASWFAISHDTRSVSLDLVISNIV